MTPGARRSGPFARALTQMRENSWVTVLGVTSLSVALAIAGAYLNLFLGLAEAGGRLFTGTAFLIVMSEKATEPQALELAGQVARYPGVARSDFVGKRQGLERFREQLGPQAGLLEGLTENPLPDLIEILMEPGLPPPPQLTAYLDSPPEVAQIVTSRPWLSRCSAVTTWSVSPTTGCQCPSTRVPRNTRERIQLVAWGSASVGRTRSPCCNVGVASENRTLSYLSIS